MSEELKGMKAYQKKKASGKWLVDPLIGEGHNALLYGIRGTAKSLFAWFIALCISKDIPLLGKYNVAPGRVLIVDEETPDADFELRIGTIIGWDNENVYTFPRPAEWGFRWSDSKWWARLMKKVEECEPSMIIWDNLNALQGKWDLEGNNSHITKARDRFNELRTHNHEIVNLFIHHEGTTPNKPRGATAIGDMSDTVIHLKRVWDNPFRFSVTSEARKRPASVKPFVVELDAKEGTDSWNLIYVGEEENATIPSKSDMDIFEYFVANKEDVVPNGKVTVNSIKNKLQGAVGENKIREAIANLNDQGAIKKKTGAHNLGQYILPDSIPNNHFNRALIETLKKDYPNMRVSIDPCP